MSIEHTRQSVTQDRRVFIAFDRPKRLPIRGNVFEEMLARVGGIKLSAEFINNPLYRGIVQRAAAFDVPIFLETNVLHPPKILNQCVDELAKTNLHAVAVSGSLPARWMELMRKRSDEIGNKTKLIARGAPVEFNSQEVQAEYGQSPSERTCYVAKKAASAGFHGILSSALDAAHIYGPYCNVPREFEIWAVGIRAESEDPGEKDPSRVTTAGEALSLGARKLIIGSMLEVPDKVAVLDGFIASLPRQ